MAALDNGRSSSRRLSRHSRASVCQRWGEAAPSSQEEEESWWLPSQLDSEVAKLTTLMTGHEVPQLRLELRRCRRHLQLALQSFREERQARQGSHGQSRDLLRALSRVQLLDGWSESSC